MEFLATRSPRPETEPKQECELTPLPAARLGDLLAWLPLSWVEEILPYRKVRILCVGDEAASFVDALAAKGYQRLAILGTSEERESREWSSQVQWIDCDFTHFLPAQAFSLWYDPGLFRSLNGLPSRLSYGHAVWNSLLPGGLALIATLSHERPSLEGALGPAFQFRSSRNGKILENGRELALTYSLFERN